MQKYKYFPIQQLHKSQQLFHILQLSIYSHTN